MLTFNLNEAREEVLKLEKKFPDKGFSIIMFVVSTDKSTKSVYYVTELCVLAVMSNIREYLFGVKEYLSFHSFTYEFLLGVSYVE